MKRMIIFCICLMLALAFGCANGAAPQPAEEGAAATPETIQGTGEAAVSEEAPPQSDDLSLFRLDAIVSLDEAGVTTVKGTDITFVSAPEGGLDTDYTLVENDTLTLTIAPDATIEFPLPDMAATVTITGAELDGEFRDFLAEHPDDGILFQAKIDGKAITGMEYFYLP